MGAPTWSVEHLDYLRTAYPQVAISLATIAAHLGRQLPAVCRMANKLGLYRIGKGYIKTFPDPFASLDAASMWVLGLWYTDGHVTRKEAYLTQKDQGLLTQVRRIIAGPSLEHRVRVFPYHGPSNSWVLQVSSVDLVRHLASYGVHPRKSLTLIFPDWMPDNVLSHFARGLWDGDGYIGFNKRKRLTVTFACGSLAFITSFALKAYAVTGKQPTVHKQREKTCYTFSLGGIPAQRFLDWLYADSDTSMRLERKYALYQQSYAA